MCLPVAGAASKSTTITVNGRNCAVILPRNYNERSQAYSWRIIFHGLGEDPNSTAAKFFGSTSRAANSGSGSVILLPEGTPNASGNRFWDSNDKCCRLGYGPAINDTDHSVALIQAAKSRFRLDDNDGVAMGFSNGAMMAQTLGRCRPDLITSVVAMAGFQPKPTDSHYCAGGTLKCHFTGIWGDADTTVRFAGVPFGSDDPSDVPSGDYYGAVENAQVWADANGCTGALSVVNTADFTGAAGNESSIYEPTTQAPGGSVVLVALGGSDHNPAVNSAFVWWLENRLRATRRT